MITLARLLPILGLAFSSAAAHAGGLTEAQLMGIYETCLTDQLRPVHEAIFSVAAISKRDREDGDSTLYEMVPTVYGGEYSDPRVGRSRLTTRYGFVDPAHGLGNEGMQYYLLLDDQFRNGRVKIEAQMYSVYQCTLYGDCDPNLVLKLRPIDLPYFQYETERPRKVFDKLGVITGETTPIKGKPRLLKNGKQSRLAFRNDDTGEPIRARNGTPLEFDVGAYTSCLTTRVDQAFAVPTKTEIASRAPGVEEASAPKSAVAASRAPDPAAGQGGEGVRALK